jgi:predicted Zn-dependent protease
LCTGASIGLLLASCSIHPKIPNVVDDRVEGILRREAARIVAVSEDRENFSQYQFFLSDFPRRDILGLSLGDRRIYISYKLASLAVTDSGHQWLLRQAIAHEVAHEIAGHAQQEGVAALNGGRMGAGVSARDVGLPWYVKFYNYSPEKELEADLKGLGYWTKLGWDCRIWVRLLEFFQERNYAGDVFHPTDERLRQARKVCESQRHEKQTARTAPPEVNRSSASVN